MWEGVSENDRRSFLPISPTAEQSGRRALQLEADIKKVFVGRSLLFLEIEKEVAEEILGDYIGAITPESLQHLKTERQEWKWPGLPADGNSRYATSSSRRFGGNVPPRK